MKFPAKMLARSVFATLLVLCAATVTADSGYIVTAQFQSRVAFQGTDVRAVLQTHDITTFSFKIYDSTLLDTPIDKGDFDGKPSKNPRVLRGVDASQTFRDSVVLNIGAPESFVITMDGVKLLPVYQTATGMRIYFAMDSFKEVDWQKKTFQFYVLKPAGAQ